MSHLAHAVRELCLHLPDAVGVVKLDRRQSEARSEEFIKAWEAARLPDDAGGFGCAVRLSAERECTDCARHDDVLHYSNRGDER